MNKYKKLFDDLYPIYGYKNASLLLMQVGLVAMGEPAENLHEDVRKYITSEEWLEMERAENRLAKIKPVNIYDSYSSYATAITHMEEQGVKDLGWLNGGINIPDHYSFKGVYHNRSGSMCLYVDPIHRVMYSVDMGD